MPRSKAFTAATLLGLAPLFIPGVSNGQDLEPRRWTHLPIGTNVASINYAYTQADINLDPALQLDNVEMVSHTALTTYTRAFAFLGTTARFDTIIPYTSAQWTGLLSGAPVSTRRDGFMDPWIRLSAGLFGTPPTEAKDFLAYRSKNPIRTIGGVALGIKLPLGQYDDNRLINLGQNRFVFRPQFGVTHTRGPWSYELTGSLFFHTDNTSFFGDTKREQDAVYAVQAHVVRSMSRRWWVAAGLGYNRGGASDIDGIPKYDVHSNLLYSVSVGAPITKTQAVKFGFLRGDTLNDIGSDSLSFFASWNIRF